jgi:hypothetical protein
MFEATLNQEFGIKPSAAQPAVRRVRAAPAPAPAQRETHPNDPWHAASAASQPYSRAALSSFASEFDLEIEDLSRVGGNLWVRADGTNELVSRVLTRWGFSNRPGKGWWK